jgi:hypothetical protein
VVVKSWKHLNLADARACKTDNRGSTSGSIKAQHRRSRMIVSENNQGSQSPDSGFLQLSDAKLRAP